MSDPGSSQGYNRYSYTSNNPINYIDPSGHKACSGWDNNGNCLVDQDWVSNKLGNQSLSYTSMLPNSSSTINGTGKSGDTKSRLGGNKEDKSGGDYPYRPDPTAPQVSIGTSVNSSCNANNLVWCFYNRGLLPTGTYFITQEQLNELMLAVYYDVNNRPYAGYFDRAVYDTPFWDWGGVAKSSICVDGACYKGTDVNYFAQGMFSAKYEMYDPGILLVYAWKNTQYHENPSSDTIYWYTVGYNYWMDQTFQLETNYLK